MGYFRKFINKRMLIILLLAFTLGQTKVQSQTVLIDPTGDGGFETGATFAANGWTAVNATLNLWEIGTIATQYAGSRGVYVANPAGTYAYTSSTSGTSHFYKDIVIPASAVNITLSFYWKGKGESGYDRTLIYTAPTTVTPVANTPSSSTTTLTGATLIWTQPTFTTTTYGLATVTIPDALAGTTVRLIFTWQNDGSLGTSPGTAIDNISLTCVIPPACTGTPTGGTANATVTSGCSGYSSTLSVTGSSVNTGLTYQWESSPTGGAPWTVIGGATSSTYTPTITSALYFRRKTLCTSSGLSDYSSSISLSIAGNDNCVNAVPINPDTTCAGFSIVSGTIGCATNSGVTAPTGTADDDVWFSFVAEATTVKVTLGNTGGSDLVTQFFTGSCGSLVSAGYYDTDPNNTGWTGLTVGTTYYIRVYSYGSSTITGTAAQFTLCVKNVLPPTPPTVQPPCTNLGFESGFTGWYGTEGNSVDGATTASTPSYIPDVYNETTGTNFAIVTAGTDPIAPINTVYNGAQSLRLGNDATYETYNGASIEQTFTVTAANTDFAYNYAVVLEDGAHPDYEQPFFQAQIFDGSGNEVTCGLFQVAAPGTGASFIQIGTTDYYYKPWTTVSVNLTAYIGQNMTVRFTVSDCSLGAHPGYAYIDCSCAAYGLISPAVICSGQPATLTAPAGAAAYLWSPGGATTASITVSPTSTTTYTCSITSQGTNPCSFNLSTTVTVNSASSTSAANDGPVCEGSTINLSCLPAGGTSYAWSGPNSFASTDQNPILAGATTAASGPYTVTVTFTGGCTGTAQTTATINSNPTVTTGNNGPICAGVNLNLTASAVGATGYNWSGPNSFSNTTQNPTITAATALASGTYTVTATFAGGCTSTSQTTVTINSSVTAAASNNSAICEGATLTLGATPNSALSYNWSGPNSFTNATQNPSISGATALAAGTYTVTVTLTGGCTGTAQTTVTINPLPTPTAGSNTPICAGTALNLTSGGGTGYSWSGPNTFVNATQNPTIANATVAADGIYTVTVTGTGGCTATTQTTVVVNANPTPTIGSNTPICQGITLNLTSGGGTGYSWSGPNSFSNATQNPSITSATTAASGTYTVTVTGTGGCTATSQTTVVVNPLPIPTIGSNSPICAGASLNLTSGGGTGYSWSGPNSYTGSTQNPTIIGATVFTDGIYIVTVTGTGGCTATAQTTVVVNANPSPTAGNSGPICSGSTLNLTSAGGTGYNWSGPNSFSNATQNPSIATATTAATGTYTVTVTGTGGCTATAQTTATVNANVTAIAGSNSAICTGATLNLTATPNGGTNYSWSGPNSYSNSTQNPSITSTTASHAGTYTVTVTLTGGCTGTAQTTVTINPLPTPTIGSNTPICAGAALNLTSGGGTGYSWSGPNSFINATQNPTISGATTAASGTYTVTVTGTGSCTSTAQTTVVVNANPTPSIGSNSPICENTPLNLTSGGGTGYSWSGPNSFINATQNPSITGATTSAAGTYTVTVTGTGSCTSTAQTTVVVNLKPTISVTPAAVQICQGNDTTLTASGATTYTWTPTLEITPTTGATTTASPTATTTYTAHGTSNGCSDSIQVIVTVINNPSITITPAVISICPGEQTTLIGSGGISYTWSPAGTPSPGTDSIITASPAGTTTYTVTGTASGCSGTATATVTIKPLPQLSFTPQNPAICINGSLSLNATGADSYQWSPDTTLSANTGAAVIASPHSSCVYTLSGTLAGCRDSIQVPFTVNPLPTIAIQANPQSGCQPFHTTFSATSNPAAQTYAWTMENSVTSILPSPAVDFWTSGQFDVSLTVTDVNGCINSITEPDYITVHPKPNVSFTISPDFGYVSKEVIFTSSISDANSQWSWNFGDGQTASSQTATTNHFYGTTGEMIVTHTYTNEFGCVDTTSLPFNVIIKIVIPNVFTPNNDGVNDTFAIEGLDFVEGAVMKIYNRWGRKVYESDSYKNDWNGGDFADGVYYYVLTLPDFLKAGPYNGTVSLLR